MKTVTKLLIYIITLFFSSVVIAQDSGAKPQGSPPIPIEVFFGNDRFVSQITINKKFTSSTKFGVLVSSYFAADYENDLRKNESMNILLLSYDIYKGLGVTSGAALNSKWGFRPFSGGLYSYADKTFFTLISSGFYLTESNNFESKVVLQYKPKLNDVWSLYSRVEFLFNQDMDTKKHERSALYGRLGLNYKAFNFGFATNYDWYGPVKFSRENYGVFISYAFK